MTKRLSTLGLAALVAGLLAATSASGATARPAARPHAHAPSHAPAHAAAPGHATPATASAIAHGSAARTLDDIHIEGEIPVPQVLFITARDQRRFVEFQHRRYLRSSRQLAEATLPPGWIVVTRTPNTPNEEIAR